MNLAPILLFVYNRLYHTQQVVKALQNNDLAISSELHIYSDGPKTSKDFDSIKAVRKYLKEIKGFRNIYLIERENNYGCSRSIVTGVTDIINKYGKAIVVEDDILTSKYFIKYMNSALDYYENQEDIACIHGYTYPIKTKLPETFFLRGADIWGWATWKRGWDLYESDAQKLLNELKSRNMTYDFDFRDSFGFTKMLEDQVKGKIDTWDIQWYASTFLRNKLTLYPGRSLVQNIGYDSSGTHCCTTNLYTAKLTDTPIIISPITISEDQHARTAIGKFHKSTKSCLLRRFSNKTLGSLFRK